MKFAIIQPEAGIKMHPTLHFKCWNFVLVSLFCTWILSVGHYSVCYISRLFTRLVDGADLPQEVVW